VTLWSEGRDSSLYSTFKNKKPPPHSPFAAQRGSDSWHPAGCLLAGRDLKGGEGGEL